MLGVAMGVSNSSSAIEETEDLLGAFGLSDDEGPSDIDLRFILPYTIVIFPLAI